MHKLAESFEITDKSNSMTAEQLKALDMRWPYPPSRINRCSECIRVQDRKDFARIKSGEKNWSQRQKSPLQAMPGSSLCESCQVSANYGGASAPRTHEAYSDDR